MTESNSLTDTAKTPKSKPPYFNIALILIVLVVFLCVVLGFSYARMQNVAGDNSQLQTQFNTLQQQIAEVKSNAQHTVSAQESQANKLASLQKSFSELQVNNTKNKRHWLIEESRYLVNMASYTLSFEKNIPDSITLLKLAEVNLSQLQDASSVNAAQVVLQDIKSLQQIKTVDFTKTYADLMTINDEVDRMPVIGSQFVAAKKAPTEMTQAPATWQQSLKFNLEKIKELIVVRHDDDAIMPVVDKERRDYLYQYLHLVLAQTGWALLQQQSTVFQGSLSTALQWTQRYFIVSDTKTQTVVKALQALQKMSWPKENPSIDQSIKVVNALQ